MGEADALVKSGEFGEPLADVVHYANDLFNILAEGLRDARDLAEGMLEAAGYLEGRLSELRGYLARH